jgi:hypothetical protein
VRVRVRVRACGWVSGRVGLCLYCLTEHAKRMRRIILSSVASLARSYFSTLSLKRKDFRGKKVIEHYMRLVFLFSSKTLSILRTIQPELKMSACKVPVILVRFK